MAHFYLPDGTCIDGLRLARKSPGALPSPTTVLSLIKSEGLIRYFKRQIFEATATAPMQPGWTDDDHFEHCLHWADEHAQNARTKGGLLHDLVQQFHMHKLCGTTFPSVPDELVEQMAAYVGWYEQYVKETLMVEQVVFGDGYAGRLDHLCLLKDGRRALTDLKSQNVKRGRFNIYSEWSLQLGAYGTALDPYPDTLVSVVVSSAEPVALEAYYWPKPPSHYGMVFKGLLDVWCEMNNYWPLDVA